MYDNVLSPLGMSKAEILEIFAHSGSFLTPDRVWMAMRRELDRRSIYSYLLRLKRQGLLETAANTRRGQLAYRLTERGYARLEYFRSHHH